MRRLTHSSLLKPRSPLKRGRTMVAAGVSVIFGIALLAVVLGTGVYGAADFSSAQVSNGAAIVTTSGATAGEAVELGVPSAKSKASKGPSSSPVPSPSVSSTAPRRG